MKMKIQLIDFGGRMPERAHDNDAGADVFAPNNETISQGEILKIPLGFGLKIPDGFAGYIFPRSGLSTKGIVCELPPIDSGYTGEVHAVVSNDSLGNKVYHNCSAYGEKGDIPKNFKQGDFVKIFGQVGISVDGNGKEYRNVNILSSKLLKAKEQRNEVSNSQETATFEKDMKDSKKAEKESVRKTINKYKDENKETAKPKKEIIKEMKEKYFID